VDPALNVAFFALHTAWMVFNCVGWAWRPTRPWQLLTLALTALSWCGLGRWDGWGYCPGTDWHWAGRARRGHRDPSSYVQLVGREFVGLDMSVGVANVIAVTALLVAAALGVAGTIRDRRRGRQGAS
jgi:hypothetical protein